MLARSRRLVWQHANVFGGRWRTKDWHERHLDELQGRTLGIIGLGTIGEIVARLSEEAEDALGAPLR